MPGRFVAIGAKLPGLYFSLPADETSELTTPLVKIRKDIRPGGHMFSLVLAVCFAFAKFHITPQAVRYFDPAKATLPNQRRISITLVFEGLFFGIEIMLVTEKLRP